MSQTPTISLEQARKLLHEADANRRVSRGRSYWNAKAWDDSFKIMSERENERDKKTEQDIIQARNAKLGDRILILHEQESIQIGGDIRWYQEQEKVLRNLRDVWRSNQTPASAFNRLTRDHARIVYRLRERQVAFYQLEIERLEEQRRLKKPLSRDWSMCWNDLLTAFREQEAAYQPAHQRPIPQAIYNQRKAWCQKIHNQQRSTASQWMFFRRGERKDLNDAIAQVEALLNRMQPPAPRFDRGALAGIGIVAAIAVVAFLLLRNPETNSASAPRQPARTAQTLAGPALAAAPLPDAPAPPSMPFDLTTLNQKAVELLTQARYQEAHDLFQQAAAANPSAYEPHNNMAFCLYELGQPEQAIEEWRQALVLSEQNSPDANAGLGMALYASGRQEEGFRYYQRASALNQDYRDENLLRSKYFWGGKAIADSRPLREQLTQ